ELKQNKVTLNISVSNSSRYNAETMAYNTDKGTGIKEMIEHFNIKQEETLVMGDSDNDRAMFEFGNFTVAMKNARTEIKALTNDVTEFT
ncbi:HAD-IIB family hydrolase, partial [Staphylococcus hominis]